MMRLAAMAVAAALLAACPATTEKADTMLPAPTPEEVSVRIGADRNGQTVEVQVGQRFAVELVGVPTAGYVWAPTQLPAFVQRAGEASGDTVPEQSEPGYAGGNHWEVLMFVATAAGTGDLVLEQRRPWETDQPPADTFRVTVTAR